MSHVVIVGTLALDTLKTPKGSRQTILGGSAVFAGISASLWANNVSLVGVVGQDFPPSAWSFLEERGISTKGVERQTGQTFHWEGYYEADMAQAFTVQTDLNVLSTFTPKLPSSDKQANVLFLANIDPCLQQDVLAQFSQKPFVVLDSMNYWIQTKPDQVKAILPQVDILILNDQEIKALTQTNSITQAIKTSATWGVNAVVVKKGEHGAIAYNGKDLFTCPAVPLVDMVDPTGAGDSFAGALCGHLSSQQTIDWDAIKKAVVAGTLTASYTVQGFGTESLQKLTKPLLREAFEHFYDVANIPNCNIDYRPNISTY